MISPKSDTFEGELYDCLTDNILPYWRDKMTDSDGEGYYGRRDGYDRLHPDAERGAILNGRILWTFASAYKAMGNPADLAAAQRAYGYIRDYFVDKEFGGVYWSVNADGTPADTKKQFYALAFMIYGLSAYYDVTADKEALDLAISLFRCVETYSRDRERGGYIEATTRDWQPIADMRLSEKDANTSKTMNTHLHILEAYTALLKVWRTPELVEAQRSLIEAFLDRIIDRETNHMRLFFDDDWHASDSTISYGHDIEASWLLLEATVELGDEAMIERVKGATLKLALASLEGYRPDGSMIYERHSSGELDMERHWWVQAETVVGLLWLAKYHDRPEARKLAECTWRYISENLLDEECGEWYWSRLADGSINRRDDKAGFWKCPYHNGRMCLEALKLSR